MNMSPVQCKVLYHGSAELFGLLGNIKTGLFLEPNERLIDLLKVEERSGADGLYARLSEI